MTSDVWAIKIISKYWNNILAVAPTPESMPTHKIARKTAKPNPALGCGHYGCVFATEYSNVVFKITTDANEAALTAWLVGLKNQPEGIVNYLAIYELPEIHRSRRVFALWREEAFQVGETPGHYMTASNMQTTYDGQVARMFTRRMSSFQIAAADARRILRGSKDPAKLMKQSEKYSQWARENYSEDSLVTDNLYAFTRNLVLIVLKRFKGSQRLAVALNICRFQAEMMANEPLGTYIGQSLMDLLDVGILLADVHLGNVGVARREDDPNTAVITDPGHAFDLAGILTAAPAKVSVL